MQMIDAKLVGAYSSYTCNRVAMNNHDGKMGAHDLLFGSTPKPYIDVKLSGGVGEYLVIAVINGVIREMATCGLNVSHLKVTTWASENGWIRENNRLTYIW